MKTNKTNVLLCAVIFFLYGVVGAMDMEDEQSASPYTTDVSGDWV